MDFQRVLSALLVIAVEGAVALAFCGAVYVLTTLIVTRVVAPRSPSLARWSASARIRARNILLAAFFVLLAGVFLANGWLFVRGQDVRATTLGALTSITRETYIAIAWAFAKLALASVGLVVAARVLRRLIAAAENAINRWDQLSSNNESLARLFRGLDRLIINSAWILLVVLAAGWFGLPEVVATTLMTVLRVYLVIAIGIMVIRCTSFAVVTIDGLSHRTASNRGWLEYYDRLQPLLPTFRACLEYVLWITVASLVLLQISGFTRFAAWGPRLIQAIAYFFLGRVVIELGLLEIGHRMLPREGLADADRRRRETMVPLVRSAFTYAAYFATAVLMLSALGFNPMPFLAGAGILGLVVGFGAQSMIDDVVSGFFILLENMYLVGDTIEVGSARGVVEAIEFRTTKIRDADGRLHVIRNGEIKPVINYSKEYTMAVVPVDVPYDIDLRSVFSTLRTAGDRLRANHPDVLADTEITGITAFGPASMTVRTSTRVRPGRHEAVAAELRFLIKELFDRQAAGAPRRTLIPGLQEERKHEERKQWPAAGRGG